MKRCPTCNQTFTDEWLTFCTQDGTSLVNDDVSRESPSPTYPPTMPPSAGLSDPAALKVPGDYNPPGQFTAPKAVQTGWQPPPPPVSYSQPEKNLALISLILGIVSITVGWCCYFGVLTGPVAVGLGIFALVQIKNDPAKYGGKGMAIGGIVTGGLYFLFLALIILIYGLSFMMSGLS